MEQHIPIAANLNLDQVNEKLKGANAETIIEWAYSTFGKQLVVSSSFGATAAVILHMVKQVVPDIIIISIDTGYLFPETYRFAEELAKEWKLDLRWYSSLTTQARQEALFGKLWEQEQEGIKKYLYINKVEPMQRALHELNASAWIAGLRADQTEHRSALRQVDEQDGHIKIHPILNWTESDVQHYMQKHSLPYHPLYEYGYRSIGDHHSTLPTTPDMDPRDGRILGHQKECGLHLPLSAAAALSLKSSGL